MKLQTSSLALGCMLGIATAAMVGWTVSNVGEEDEGGGEQTTVIQYQEAPAAVRASFAKLAEGATASRVERIDDEGITVFEIEYPMNGGTASMTLAMTGQSLEMESPVAVNDLPEVLRQNIAKHHPDAKIVSADAVQTFAYEIQVNMAGKSHEIKALATGKIKGKEGDEHAKKGENEEDEHHGKQSDDEEDDD